jgi:chorismate mutase/prephenate dehydratase
MAGKASIPALRRQIDRIDDQLLRLLNRRAALALAIAEQKARSNSGVYAPAREKGVLGRLARANHGPLPETLVRAIFREIISASRALEQRLRIAYFGPEGTFTHVAARRQFGAAADYVPAASIADVFRDVEAGRADLGVVPVENSSEGMVAHTLDVLAESPLAICAEILLPVRHNLLARPGTAIAQIERVVAHPQALAQCRRWLVEHLPGVPANVTRFVVVAAHDEPQPSGDDKTSILFSVRDEVGILARMLRPFATHGIDLIKIESRPLRGRAWEYVFFLDLKGHRRETRVQEALAAVERSALRLKVLGSYPAAPSVSEGGGEGG